MEKYSAVQPSRRLKFVQVNTESPEKELHLLVPLKSKPEGLE
jgi:hypothetical protein